MATPLGMALSTKLLTVPQPLLQFQPGAVLTAIAIDDDGDAGVTALPDSRHLKIK